MGAPLPPLARRSEEMGTPEQVRERVEALEDVGVDLLLLQFSPQYEEMERFAAQVIAARPMSLAS